MKEWTSPFNPFNSLKLLLWSDRVRGILDGKFYPPVSVTVDPTNSCNYSCRDCIFEMQAGKRFIKESLSRKELFGLADFLGSWEEDGRRVESVCIAGGGEPLLNLNTFEFIERLRDRNLEVSLITNGSLISFDNLRLLVDNLKFIGISMNAGNASSYSVMQGVQEKYFYKVINRVSALIAIRDKYKSKMTVGYKFLFSPSNYRTIYMGALIAKTIGIDDFRSEEHTSELQSH